MNNKGFVLVETLIVTVFVVAIFTIVYTNFYPLIGEYDRRENYDDVDSVYGAYWVKKMIQESDYDISCPAAHCTPINAVPSVTFRTINCDALFSDNENKRGVCNHLFSELKIKMAIATTYDLTSLKAATNKFGDINSYGFQNFSQGFKDYISYLPNYKTSSLNGANYRVIVEFEREALDGVGDSIKYNTYANMEVLK